MKMEQLYEYTFQTETVSGGRSPLTLSLSTIAQAANDKVVIAHRGASGYLPEHTLPAKALAYARCRLSRTRSGDDKR